MIKQENSFRMPVALVRESFGAYPPPAIPDTLADLLFNDQDGSCFALLDAARMPQLPQVLAGTDLEHACLFQGEAEKDMEDVAPWLVRLAPESRFVRRLLSGPETQWGLWNRDASVFLRSRSDLWAVRKHFRRMTRLYDPETGRWFFFRFYAAPTMRDLVAGMDTLRLQRLFGPVSRFVVPAGDDAVLVIDNPDREGR